MKGLRIDLRGEFFDAGCVHLIGAGNELLTDLQILQIERPGCLVWLAHSPLRPSGLGADISVSRYRFRCCCTRRSAPSFRSRRLIIRPPSSDATINVATAAGSTPGRVSP